MDINLIKETFGTLSKSLEILYLLEDVKPCVRQGFYDNELDKVREFCKNNGLQMITSDFKILLDSKTNKGAYSNRGIRVSILNPDKGMNFVYISRSKDRALKAKEFENNNDHKNLGIALGYPSCCCDFFLKHEPEQSKKNNDYILPILNNSKGFKFPKETNICGRYFDYTLLNHFPCDFNCNQSINLAKKYLNTILKNDENLAFQILDILNSAVVYHEFAGVFLLHDYILENNNLKFDSILDAGKGRLLEDLKEFKQIDVIDKNSIELGGEKIGDPNFGVMIFS